MNLSKKTKINLNFGATVVIVIGILAVLNFFSYNIFHRFDLTQNKDYSLSNESKQTAGNLNDIVNINVYLSGNLPSQYVNLRQDIGDILDEYASYSKGKVKVAFIDPKDDKNLQSELYADGIPELQFNVLQKDQYQVVNGYMGILIQYGDKKEPIPVADNTKNLEYEITLAIKKVTGQINANVGFATSNGILSTTNDISDAYKSIADMYNVENVDLNSKIPEDLNTLIIVGPKDKFTTDEQKNIDAFLMRGGSILFLLDGVKIDTGLIASANNVGLDNLLENYGLKLNHDLVLDTSAGMASFTQGFLSFATPYPFWPKITQEGFDRNDTAVAKLGSLILPWASSVETTSNMDKSNSVSYLVKTTNEAWRQTKNFDLNPQTAFNSKDGNNQYDLAIAAFGKFKSAFGNGETNNGRIILVGNSQFLEDKFLNNAPDNLVFFQNLVDSLSLDQGMIAIRSKGLTERPIKNVSDAEKAFARYGNIFGLTVIVLIFGLARYYLRRRIKSDNNF